jgi:hypothetical protein
MVLRDAGDPQRNYNLQPSFLVIVCASYQWRSALMLTIDSILRTPHRGTSGASGRHECSTCTCATTHDALFKR